MANKIQVRDLRNGDWFWINKIVLEKYASKIGSTGIAVYGALCYFANQNTQKLFPNYTQIAEKSGCSWRTVQRTILILEKNKLIKKEKRSSYHYVYTILKICQNGISKNEICQNGILDMPNCRTNRCINKNYLTRINKIRFGEPNPPQRKNISFKKKDYDIVLEEYQKLRDIKLQGKEFDPVMQEIKTMFLSGRSVNDIIGCMQWLAGQEQEWMQNWTIKTVKLKLPFFLSQPKPIIIK